MKYTLHFLIILVASFAMAQPNIVWITSEDNSMHYMKMFHPDGVETPNIATLAEKGVQFNRAFSNAPVCSAARTTLITGVYGPKLASHYHRTEKKIQLPPNIKMFPEYLRQLGYYTTNNAKEDYNVVKGAAVWDESSRKASWRNRKEGQPFFHVQNFNTTHEGKLHFSQAQLAMPTNVKQNPSVVQPNHPNTKLFQYTNAYYRDLIVKMDKQVGEVVQKLKDDNLLEDTIIFYFGDHGGVLPFSKGYLKETGLHVPLVVYVPEKYKHLSPYDLGTSTNDFVSFIDFSATVLALTGREIPSSIDGRAFFHHRLEHTDAAKAEKNKTIYGYADKMGEKHDMVRSVRKEMYGYADRFDEKYDMVRTVRKGEFKYIRNFQPYIPDGLMNNYRYKMLAYKEWRDLFDQGKLNEQQSRFFEPKLPEELYSIENDPYETNNLANDPNYTQELIALRESLNDWMLDLPDLSFYPEHHLTQFAAANPIAFGAKNKKNIRAYLNIANLQLQPFTKVKSKLAKCLRDKDPIKRYWALTSCARFGADASELSGAIEKIFKTDDYTLNRVRAAEFLGIMGRSDTSAALTDLLYQSTVEYEALQILNTIVLLRDFYDHTFEVNAEKIKQNIADKKIIKSRLDYLNNKI